MNNGLGRKYFLISVAIHLGVFMVLAFVIHNNRISKTFLVFGAHSKKPTHAVMKLGRKAYVPFVGGGKARGGKRGAASSLTKKPVTQKNKSAKMSRQRVRAKKAAPTVIKKETAVLEKQTKQTALAAGVSVHKKLKIKKMQAEKLRKLKELEARRAEKERREHEEALRRARELRIAQLEAEYAKKEARKRQEDMRRAQEEKKKVLLAQKEAEKEVIEEDSIPRENSSRSNSQMSDDVGSGENVFAENGQDIMEFNLLAESDQELRVYQRSIQNEVSRLWHPPVGVPKGTTCRVMFAVGRDGSIEKFEFVVKSKMLIYDLSVLRVAKQFKFDNCLWGKRFTIDFCQ